MFIQDVKVITELERYTTINQSSASSSVSEKYKFIPTKNVLNILGDFGWFPVAVVEAGIKNIENKGYQKHSVKLFNQKMNDSLDVGSTIPQLLLTNSHSGSSSFRFDVSLYEKVCMNGLIVDRGESNFFRIPHRGYTDEKVLMAISQATEDIPEILEKSERYKKIVLDSDRCHFLAEKAIEMRFDTDKYLVVESDVLRATRRAQREPTLWNVFNVVQEAIIRGGIWQRKHESCATSKSRPIKSIDESIRLNKGLWRLAELMYESLKVNKKCLELAELWTGSTSLEIEE
jgi:Domain of unknown function (DUF932)